MLNRRMNVHRLFLPFPITGGQASSVSGDRAHYVHRVLRLRAGDKLSVFDGGGCEYPADITEIRNGHLRIMIGQPQRRDNESPLSIHFVPAVSRGERMDFSIQKATELGVARISPVFSDRSIVRLTSQRAEKRRDHWQKIVQSACEQCGRNTVPAVDTPQTLADWIDSQDAGPVLKILLRPDALRTVGSLPEPKHGIVLLIGPEGGFSDMEYDKAAYSGFESVSLGPRVLRTETAAVAAIAVLQANFGDLSRRCG